jgi:hypothetical protein
VVLEPVDGPDELMSERAAEAVAGDVGPDRLRGLVRRRSKLADPLELLAGRVHQRGGERAALVEAHPGDLLDGRGGQPSAVEDAELAAEADDGLLLLHEAGDDALHRLGELRAEGVGAVSQRAEAEIAGDRLGDRLRQLTGAGDHVLQRPEDLVTEVCEGLADLRCA